VIFQKVFNEGTGMERKGKVVTGRWRCGRGKRKEKAERGRFRQFSCRRCDKETTCELSVTARALSIFLLRAQ
jgi:hypothetical protein